MKRSRIRKRRWHRSLFSRPASGYPGRLPERLQAVYLLTAPMLRLEFTGQSVDAPLLSETARRFNVNNNIISAQMDYAGGVKFRHHAD